MPSTAVFYTAISRLHFISKHTSVSTDQNWATVLQCINQISLGPPCQEFILIETRAYQQNMETCKRACSSSSLIRENFRSITQKGKSVLAEFRSWQASMNQSFCTITSNRSQQVTLHVGKRLPAGVPAKHSHDTVAKTSLYDTLVRS